MPREIQLISTQQLAVHLGYEDVSKSFYHLCRELRIVPVPGRRGWYDPKLVRSRLDQAQGMVNEVKPEGHSASVASGGLVEQRRARLGQA